MIPPIRIPRQRLVDRLTAGFDGEVTPVSAQVASGKTTLLAHWLQARGNT
jgi:ATP/maltotriose-dependent transcriptional regulator MalT